MRRSITIGLAAALVAVGMTAIPATAADVQASAVQVTDLANQPVAGAQVRVTSSVTGYTYTTSTGDDGVAALTTIPGVKPEDNPYLVWIQNGPAGSYWDGSPSASTTQRVSILASAPTLAVAAPRFVPPPTGSTTVSGRITDALTDQPIADANVSVTARDYSSFYGWGTSTGTGDYSAAITGSLPADAIVSFFSYSTGSSAAPWGYATQFWRNAPDAAAAETVRLVADEPVVNIDAALTPQGAITGVVNQNVTGTAVPVPNAAVAAFDETSTPRSYSMTDDSGAYTLPLPAGTYRVGFGEFSSGPSVDTGYDFTARQYFDLAGTLADATPVTVAPAQATANINALYDAAPDATSITPGAVTIVGEPQVGSILTADPGTWEPAGVQLSYQWFRGGTAIDGATAGTYVPSAADIGFALKVTVSGSKEGLNPASATSNSTAAVTDPNPGAIRVIVVDSEDNPVPSTPVGARLDNGSNIMFSATTGPDGTATMTGTPRGTYTVTAYPQNLAGASRTVTVAAGTTTDVRLDVNSGLPDGMTIAGSTPSWNGGVSVPRDTPFTLTVTDDPGALTAVWRLTKDGGATDTGSLAEDPAGTYSAILPGLNPGRYTLTTELTYPGGIVHTEEAVIYIDPSGTIVDQYGTPVAGAAVTLSRSDTESGPYTPVPDGSTIMSPANRTNPDTSGADGSFGWDTIPGWYTVTAASGAASVATPGLQVPPERLDLILALPIGSEPLPQSVPTITGDAKVGRVLNATSGTWPTPAGEPAPIEAIGYQWLRNGTPIAGATSSSYTVTRDDVATRLSVQLTLGRQFSVEAGAAPMSWTYVTGAVRVPETVLPTTGADPVVGALGATILLLGLGSAAVVIGRRRASVS